MIFSSPAILSLLLATSSVCSTSSFQIPVPCSSKTSARALEATNDVTETLDPFFSSSECDDSNTPPALGVTLRALDKLANGSDIRGKFVDHARIGSFAQISRAIQENSGAAALTPLAAHCLGYAFATMLKAAASDDNNIITICVGNDPREHGPRLADAFGRGAQGVQGVLVKYTGIASTPAMNDFCRAPLFCDGAVILTASHLPKDRNGLKFFTAAQGGFTRTDIQELVALAKEHVQTWQSMGIIPPTSGTGGVFCSEWVCCFCSNLVYHTFYPTAAAFLLHSTCISHMLLPCLIIITPHRSTLCHSTPKIYPTRSAVKSERRRMMLH
mmetsp:Transcript_21976/g.36376  ORF Transcript_21976/g.36376 Transcript_21976/m.36376 type:complete len:328 (-) Transcript_21976:1082-2065(-)